MRGKYPCGWCGERFKNYTEARKHGPECEELKRRLRALPSDLEIKVHRGGMKLEAAEAEAAKRPAIRL